MDRKVKKTRRMKICKPGSHRTVDCNAEIEVDWSHFAKTSPTDDSPCSGIPMTKDKSVAPLSP
ncbi:hypothetical protein DPMN_102246 [Dreissena polymorpha]|uniref:Uncharacterized protein n=1 Tax=Dreissena polymorpha TaxID=45954 RepID=A0A9D4LIQ7_DREPO|nr:hypothetical protein DPMN_102246 [Dreissena polymorpha]